MGKVNKFSMNNQKINYSKLFDELYPIPRSILGEGFRNSLNIIGKYIKLKKLKYKSGKKIYDWTVPKEWILNDAYIKFKGKKDFGHKKKSFTCYWLVTQEK